MNSRPGMLRLADLTFGDYWPPGTPDLVRAFLKEKIESGESFPELRVAEVNGEYHLFGWENKPGEPGLLEAARGWALTENEERWVRFLTGNAPTVSDKDAGFIAMVAMAERLGFVEFAPDGKPVLTGRALERIGKPPGTTISPEELLDAMKREMDELDLWDDEDEGGEA